MRQFRLRHSPGAAAGIFELLNNISLFIDNKALAWRSHG
jgi:hypothetical protein